MNSFAPGAGGPGTPVAPTNVKNGPAGAVSMVLHQRSASIAAWRLARPRVGEVVRRDALDEGARVLAQQMSDALNSSARACTNSFIGRFGRCRPAQAPERVASWLAIGATAL